MIGFDGLSGLGGDTSGSGYGAPSTGYDAPSTSYGSPPSSYDAPSTGKVLLSHADSFTTLLRPSRSKGRHGSQILRQFIRHDKCFDLM